ncbi:MAG: Gfo/Idh/MocA family oxidoreductase [Planctomycetes bacterium]|nr:Gfo/Idh/MocA family oxidoreductase [Planctomycetota bacterium]
MEGEKAMAMASVTLKELGLPEALPMPKRRDWRIGMIGFGGIARGAHVPAYRSVGWNVVAIADPDPAAQQAAREKFGIPKVYSDYHDLVADPEVEIIDLLTHPTLREAAVLAAAEAKKPIATEKPLAGTLGEAERIVAIAADAGVPFAVHQNYRWRKCCYLAHHIVQKGLIGTPFLAAIEIIGTQDVHLAKHHFYAVCSDFLTVQWNTHLADLLRFWTGRDAARVLARTGRMSGQNFVSDNLLIVLYDFGPGLTGHVLHTELLRSSGAMGGVRCRLDGDKGSIVFDFDSQLTLDSLVLGGGPRTLDTGAGTFTSSFAGSMGDFLLAIEERREPLVSARRNLATIRTIFAEHRSTREGGVWLPCT